MNKVVSGVLRFTIAAAAVGGICYALKDKIKETEVYKNRKIFKKDNVSEDDSFDEILLDDTNDFDDLDDEEFENEIPERNYVTIKSSDPIPTIEL